MNPIGLRERIKNAKTEAEVKLLLNDSSNYLTASAKTKRRWNEAFRNWTAPKAKQPAAFEVARAKTMKLAEVAVAAAAPEAAAPVKPVKATPKAKVAKAKPAKAAKAAKK